MYTLIPLGNPGPQYEKTRHNAARIVMGYIDEGAIPLEMFVPDTFMNESGLAVSAFLRYHNDREIIVMYDDKDLPLGSFRISFDKSDGGHNGVKSIIGHMGTTEFIRVRIGIAPQKEDGTTDAPHGEEVQKYVMAHFREEELKTFKEIAPKVEGALKDIVVLGYQKAMERNN